MDCTKGQNHELCKQEGVEGYPTFNYYNYGKFVEKYNGDRGVSATTNLTHFSFPLTLSETVVTLNTYEESNFLGDLVTYSKHTTKTICAKGSTVEYMPYSSLFKSGIPSSGKNVFFPTRIPVDPNDLFFYGLHT